MTMKEKINTYVVGGAVRDVLLELPISDIDYVVVGATPKHMIDVLQMTQVGADFPVFLNSQGDEYALARTERKVGVGYHGFNTCWQSTITLQQDQLRRDLTVNQLAVHVDDWERFKTTKNTKMVIDSCNGLSDLRDGILRHVSLHFREDPVRLLRIARFQARYNFRIADATKDLMVHMVQNGEVNNLTSERIWLEVTKVLNGPRPMTFFWTLRMCGALEKAIPGLSKILPSCGAYVSAASIRNMDFTIKCILLFAQLDDPETVMTKLKTPTSLIKHVKNFKRTIVFVKGEVATTDSEEMRGVVVYQKVDLTPRVVLEYLKSINVYKMPDVIFMMSTLLSVIDSDKAFTFDKTLMAFNVTKGISFQSLSDEQQEELHGPSIANAIDDLKVEAIAKVL